MKKYIFICPILAFFAVFKVDAQNAQVRITEQFNEYSKLVVEKNFEKAIEYTNSGLFKIISKEQMLSLLKRTFNSADFEYKVGLPTLTDFQPVKIIRDSSYVKFASQNVLQLKFKDDTSKTAQSAEDKKRASSLRKLALTNQFGAANVSFDESTGFFAVNSKKIVIAASNQSQTDWKFVIIENERLKKILKVFIPAEVLE